MKLCLYVGFITKISSAHGYKNSASSNSDEVIHGLELISQHSKRAKNYTKAQSNAIKSHECTSFSQGISSNVMLPRLF
jgi:hypothetical protein